MIPTIWRFLIKEYGKVFLLCLTSFIALLVVTRLEEIAQVASFGASIDHVILFALYQIPYILPIAIPLSSLIAALLLFQRLSNSHELNAFRACGISFSSLLAPLLLTASLLSFANFTVVSEVATASHLATRKMVYNLTAKNPLILLQNARIAPLKGAYIQFSPLHSGKEARDLLISWGNKESGRLNLLLAKKIKIKGNDLIGRNISLISSGSSEEENYLMIENQEEAKTPAFECALFLHGKGWKMANDHLKFNLLQVRIKKLQEQKRENTFENVSINKNINKCYAEIFRRISFGLAPLTFTLMGAIFAIRIGRNISKTGLVTIFFLTAFSLISFFTAKQLHQYIVISTIGFFLPHLLLISSSLFVLNRLNHGYGK